MKFSLRDLLWLVRVVSLLIVCGRARYEQAVWLSRAESLKRFVEVPPNPNSVEWKGSRRVFRYDRSKEPRTD